MKRGHYQISEKELPFGAEYYFFGGEIVIHRYVRIRRPVKILEGMYLLRKRKR